MAQERRKGKVEVRNVGGEKTNKNLFKNIPLTLHLLKWGRQQNKDEKAIIAPRRAEQCPASSWGADRPAPPEFLAFRSVAECRGCSTLWDVPQLIWAVCLVVSLPAEHWAVSSTALALQPAPAFWNAWTLREIPCFMLCFLLSDRERFHCNAWLS